MGMPISVALRGRHAATAAGRSAWRAVVAELREVDRVFSTHRKDSAVSRLGRRELTVDQCPAVVAEVLALGATAEQESDGAFSIWLPAEARTTPTR
jgi:thiamine biosynthesis lipoprotein